LRTYVAFRSSIVLAFRSSVMLCLAGLALVPSALGGQDAASLPLMPLPSHVTEGAGQFLVTGDFSVAAEGYADPRVALGRQRFLNKLWRETGIPFQTGAPDTGAAFLIKTSGPSQEVQQLGEDESYRLVITPAHVELTAANVLGVLHGLQTFLQLVHITPQGFAVPVLTIDDQPRFPWRGVMIDTGRHFMPLPVVERNLDGMEAVKLNVFHWHLSDDQGFRVESKQFPLLQEKGSNGHYYTQEQVREVIEYARVRGIRVVPEFDMPCHATSWFAGYPQLASGSGPYQPITKWGIFDPAMDPTRESTFEFLDKFLAEMTALFPDVYFHIGGDECDGKEWDANPRVKQFMREHNIKDNAALQSYFSGRVQKLVAGHNKIMEGWDEVLQPDTPRDVVIQSWRGPRALAAAARQGNRVLLSNGYYIDLNQPASEHYLVDPLGGDGAKLDSEQRARVLGGEAAMWSEFVTPENIDSRIWPRTAAIAERFWSPQDVRDVDSMYRRMALVSEKLNDDGLKHNSFTLAMLQRMSGNANPEALEVLAAVVQPPKGYAREELKQYTVYSPLNELVDAVVPESETARKFNHLATLAVAGKATPEQLEEARIWLELWRDNDAKLAPSLKDSDLTVELAPLSRSLSEVASVGLKALDDLKNHRTMSAEARDRNLELLKAAGKPKAVLLDKIVPSVLLLVNASGK
jgi:hexosaminidase